MFVQRTFQRLRFGHKCWAAGLKKPAFVGSRSLLLRCSDSETQGEVELPQIRTVFHQFEAYHPAELEQLNRGELQLHQCLQMIEYRRPFYLPDR